MLCFNILLLGPSTLHCSVDGLELFSCCVSQEDDTALSILDPVSIGVELKPLDTPSKDGGTHTLEVSDCQIIIKGTKKLNKKFMKG